MPSGRLRLKCDGTRAETRSRLSTKRTIPFKSAGGCQFSRLLAADVCPSAVVMLDTPCSEVAWKVLATHSIRQFPLHLPSRVPSHFNWTLHGVPKAEQISSRWLNWCSPDILPDVSLAVSLRCCIVLYCNSAVTVMVSKHGMCITVLAFNCYVSVTAFDEPC